MFIFVLQTVWLYIGELAGKDIDFSIILKFLWFALPKLIPLVLPLTILVSSLMVFGSFSEKYEFAAMKSTGISLQRAMRSLMVFIFILAITAFFFANNVIPYSEYKWQNLRRNIAQVSPSMAISEGQFSSIGDNFTIKVAKKYGDRKQFLKEVVIHKKNPNKPSKNSIVVIAKEGELASEKGSNTLSLILKDGNYYEDIQLKNSAKQRKQPFAKSEFEQYILNIDLTELNDTDIDKQNKLSSHNMLTTIELISELDTLSKAYSKDIKLFGENMYFRTGINRFKDTIAIHTKHRLDTVYGTMLAPFNSKLKSEILATAIENTKGTLQSIKSKKAEFQHKIKRLNKHEIALHEKYVLAIACIILFFVGAPLGAIIRKGGLGLPMVIAIVLFLSYHFIGIFAKNSAEDDSLSPFIASWLSTLIMLPLGVWLTYRATTDQGIIDMDSFTMRFKKIFFNKKADDLSPSKEKRQLFLTQQERAIILSKNNIELKLILESTNEEYSEDFKEAILRKLEDFK